MHIKFRINYQSGTSLTNDDVHYRPGCTSYKILECWDGYSYRLQPVRSGRLEHNSRLEQEFENLSPFLGRASSWRSGVVGS
jgi:hypothetical protein